MTLTDFLHGYLGLLWQAFVYDMEVLSKPWMYWCFLIPAFFYLIFFVIKWMILTLPLWLPVNLALQPLSRSKCENTKSSN